MDQIKNFFKMSKIKKCTQNNLTNTKNDSSSNRELNSIYDNKL